MYNPEEDIVPYELLEQALMISKVSNPYKVYFDKENGNIISVSNENLEFSNSIDVEYDIVKDFFIGKKNIVDYKILFVDQTTPTIVSKFTEDINLINIEEVKKVDNWDNIFTIENYVLLKKWGFQLRPDQREIFKNYNLNTTFEVFVVDKDYHNQLIRTIKIPLYEVLNNSKFFVPYQAENEADKNKIFVKRFFSTIGYQILYDTES